jgi:glutamate-1-semialdehyde 2,1-aminomutase
MDESFAAIIAEPLQSVGGMIPASREFLQTLRDVATSTGAVLVFDEVVTSRLGYRGLQGLHEIYPDLTTIGKFWGGGFSFGAFGGRLDIMKTLEPGAGRLSHSG